MEAVTVTVGLSGSLAVVGEAVGEETGTDILRHIIQKPDEIHVI